MSEPTTDAQTATIERPEPPAATAPAKRPAPRRSRKDRLIPVLLVLLGALTLVYPVAGTIWNNSKQAQFAREYDSKITQVPASTLSDAIAKAQAYNASMTADTLRDPWGGGGDTHSGAYEAYLKQLDLFDAMARIRVPNQGIDLPVFHGTQDAELARGAGHMFGTSLPVGGTGTRAVVTGHSAFPTATLFDNVPKMVKGETFFIDVYGQTLAYRVDAIEVVKPEELGKLTLEPGRDLVTLVTCTPYSVNSHRLLVTGVRIPYDAAHDPGAAPALLAGWTLQPWMMPRLYAAGAALLLLVGMVVRWVINDRRERRAAKRQAMANTAAA